MKFLALLTGSLTVSSVTAQMCTDCNGKSAQCSYVGDDFCDNNGVADFNCSAYNYDNGDCEMVIDCYGNMHFSNLIGDGSCDNGYTYKANFDCTQFMYDGGDCGYRLCDGTAVDAYTPNTGTCREEYNCKKFEYDEETCVYNNVDCPDDWYTMGQENFRCSERNGGERFASYNATNGFDACECYDWCQMKAAQFGVDLVAFDQYSTKCRCWTGDCTEQNLRECKDDGETDGAMRADPDRRCPAATYFPFPVSRDCNDNDVTPFIGTYNNQYAGDKYCDNQQYGNGVTSGLEDAVGDYDCMAHDYDDTDCDVITCDQRFAGTKFADLSAPNQVCDGDVTAETAWTTACDCYEFCADQVGQTDSLIFQRNDYGQCQCIDFCDTESNCGLESDCQIYRVDRYFDCCGTDWTLGVVPELLQPGQFEPVQNYFNTQTQLYQEVIPKVFKWTTFVNTYSNMCLGELMCDEYDYSDGYCLGCSVTQTDLDNDAVHDSRCDMNQNNAQRFSQWKDFFAIGTTRDFFDVNDYCDCEYFCKLKKFESFSNSGSCGAVSGLQGYQEWESSNSTRFAIDAYKGDCRCWDYCVPDTLWDCTAGSVNRCVEQVGVYLYGSYSVVTNPPVRGVA